jgi:hypothetical protein
VVVHSGAEEGGLLVGVPVARGQPGQVLEHVLLRATGGQVELASQPHALGDLREQVVDRVDADRVEHLAQIPLGDSRVAAHFEDLRR